jgi:methylglutaconyl-CoA hydratase
MFSSLAFVRRTASATKSWKGLHRSFTKVVGFEVQTELLEGEDTGIATLTLNRPYAKNSLGSAMIAEFRGSLDSLRFNPNVRAVVLRSCVPRVFCAGADLKERATMTRAEVAAFVHGLRSAFTDLSTLPMPVISAIEGAALGGGLELCLACDFRIAGADALFGLPETSLAIIPGAGGTQRLPRLIGIARAKELIFTGRRLTATEALGFGLVGSVAPAGHAYALALNLAREILPRGPVAVRAAKEAIDRGMETDLTTGLAIEKACYAQVIPTADRLEGLKAFAEKRAPVYRGE